MLSGAPALQGTTACTHCSFQQGFKLCVALEEPLTGAGCGLDLDLLHHFDVHYFDKIKVHFFKNEGAGIN